MPLLASAKKPAAADEEAKLERLAGAVRTLLLGVGEDLGREGLVDTPRRVAKALLEMSRGYRQVHTSALGEALFHEPIVHEGGQGIVLVRDIEFASTSEDTLLPFHGRCHIAYVPTGGTVIGLSKLARLTKLMAKRLMTQERLGQDLALALQQHMSCQGVAVVIVATHLALAGPAPPQEQATVSVSGCFAAEHSSHLQMLMDMLCLPDLPASSVHKAPSAAKAALPSPLGVSSASRVPAPASRSTGSSCGDSVAVDSSDKDCELSEKEESAEIEERLSSMSTEDGERLGACLDWDGDHAAAQATVAARPPAKAHAQHPWQHSSSKGPDSSTVVAMEAAVQSLLAEMGECPSRTGLQGSARRYVAALLASTSGYTKQHCMLLSGKSQGHPPSMHWEPQQQQQQQQQQCMPSSCSCCSDQSQRSVGLDDLAIGAEVPQSSSRTLIPTPVPVSVMVEAAELKPDGGERPRVGLAATAAAARQAAGLQAQGAGEQVQLCSVRVLFNSQCEHHMLPFYGSACVVFLPKDGASSSQHRGVQGGGASGGVGHGDNAGDGWARCSDSECAGTTRCAAGDKGQRLHDESGSATGCKRAAGGAGVERTHRCADARERRVIESIVGTYTQRLQVQERITHQVADAVAAELEAAAVVVVVDATHMCMVARGVENHAGGTTTMACRGLAQSDPGLCRQALLEARQHGQSRHKK